MKIIEENTSRLGLRDFPSFSVICCMLFLITLTAVAIVDSDQLIGWKRFAVLSAGLGVTGALLIIARRTEVILDKGTNRFSLTRKSLFGINKFQCALTDISSVCIEELPGVKPTDHFRRITVMTNQDRIPLTIYWHTNKDECQKISGTIEDFLHIRSKHN